MSNVDKYKEELLRLIARGYGLVSEEFSEHGGELVHLGTWEAFTTDYQLWYTESLAVIKQLLPDRYKEFVDSYEGEVRGWLTEAGQEAWSVAYVEDYIAMIRLQVLILHSAATRFESSLFEIRQMVQADLFDSELESAKELNKQGFSRCAGAVAGVVLEKHLSHVTGNHDLRVGKQNPGISDFNEKLKSDDVIDVPIWRNIQRLADLRNLCDHGKDREPSRDDVAELIDGVEKITKTLF